MKKRVHLLLTFCLAIFLMGTSLDTFAWGGDITLPTTAGYKYSNTRISVAYNGTIYYGRTYAIAAGASISGWEVLKSTDNGITFTNFTSGSLGVSTKVTAFDFLCVGENATDFGIVIARGYLDTIAGTATLYADKFDTATNIVSTIADETFNYLPARGWNCVSLATDSRDPNFYSAPYVISLVASKASPSDSIIVWTGNDGGATSHRRGIASTVGFFEKVSASVGCLTSTVTGYGRLGVAWEEFSVYQAPYGSIKWMFLYPDDATNSVYPGPFTMELGAENYRNPCMIMSQNTAGGTGPGGQDFRGVVTTEYNGDGNVWGMLFDSIIAETPNMTWCRISAGPAAGINSSCHGVFDPLYNNFLFTYYNTDVNALVYAVKLIGTPAAEDPIYFQPNYRDLSTPSSIPMNPRVDMSVSRGMAAFGWTDNGLSMFDAEWSTAGISANTGLTELNLYPNPAIDQTNISFVANESQTINITIMDLSGRIAINTEYYATEGNNLIPIATSDLSAGNYIIRMTGSSISSNLKLIVTE
jgi:hypothetical protein